MLSIERLRQWEKFYESQGSRFYFRHAPERWARIQRELKRVRRRIHVLTARKAEVQP